MWQFLRRKSRSRRPKKLRRRLLRTERLEFRQLLAAQSFHLELDCAAITSLFGPNGGGDLQQVYVNNPNTTGSGNSSSNSRVCVIDDNQLFGPVVANSVYSVPAKGILRNDLIASPSNLTAVRESKQSAYGALVEIYSDGSFSYDGTSAQAIRQLQTNQSVLDWFEYTASLPDGDSGHGRVTLKVDGRNDPPELVHAHQATVDEASTFVLGNHLLRARDVDNSLDELVFELSQTPQYGLLENTNQPGVPISSFTQAEIDAQQIVYRHDGSETLSDRLALTITDAQGARAADAATIDISVVSINDIPSLRNPLPTHLSAVEDTVSPLDLQFLEIEDADAGNNLLTLKLSVTHGQLIASSSFNLSILGAGTDELTIEGSLSALQAYFGLPNRVQFLGDLNLSGNSAAQLTITASDNGYSGLGGSQTVSLGTIPIHVAAQNDDPQNIGSLPPLFTVDPGIASALDFTSIILDDSDAGVQDILLTLQTPSGHLLASSSAQVVITGSNTNSISLRGDLTALNAYLQNAASIQLFIGLGNATHGVGIQISVNDLGHSGSGGGNEVNLGTVSVDVTGINDPPANVGSLPSLIALTEDTIADLDLHSLEIADVDIGSGDLTLTLTANNAALYATANSGVAITGSGTNSIRLIGTQASLNAYLDQIASIQILGGLNANGVGADSLSMALSDELSSVQLGTVQVDIAAVNDPPINAGSLPSLVAFTENILSSLDLSLIEPVDVDIGNGHLTLTLSATNGTLQAFATAGIAVTGNGTDTLQLIGALADLEPYLHITTYIQFLGALDLYGPGAASIAVALSDEAATSQLGTIQVDLVATNHPPTYSGTLPTTLSAIEDLPVDIDLTAIDLDDVDIGSGNLTVILTANDASLHATIAPGVGIVGNGTSMVSLTGSLTDINAYLDVNSNLQLLGALNLNGIAAASTSIAISDGVNVVQLGTILLDIAAVNDPPINLGNLPTSLSVLEDTAADLNLCAILLEDVDIGLGNLTVLLTATNATVHATPNAGVLILGNGSDTVRLIGTPVVLNAYFDVANHIQVLGDLNVNGTAAAAVSVTVGDGNSTTPFGSIQIDIASVDDSPFNAGSLPLTLIGTEDVWSGLDLSLIDLFDVDSNPLTVTLTATNATLQASAMAGITILGNGTDTLSLAGDWTDLNAYFGVMTNLQFLGALNLYGISAASVAVAVSDGSTTSPFGSIQFDLAAVNDAPSFTGILPNNLSAIEDISANLDLTAIDLHDVDIGGSNLTVTLVAINASLTATASPGISIAGNGTSTLTLLGSLTDINAYLDISSNLQLLGALHLNGMAAAAVSIAASDGINISTLGSLQVDIAAVNDPPINLGSLPSNLSAIEDTLADLNLSSMYLEDVDIGLGNLTVTLMASNATIHATANPGITINGNNSSLVSLTGTLASLNAYFAIPNHIQALGDLNLNGTAAASIAVADSDGITTVHLGTIQIDIAAVNDPPGNTGSLPNSVTGIEDVLSPANLSMIHFTDVDIGGGNLTVTFTSTHATLHAAVAPGITVVGNNSTILSLIGTPSVLNAYLETATNLQLLGDLNLNGLAAGSISIAVSDGFSNTPLGTIQVDLTAVNDPPTHSGTLPNSLAILEDVDTDFSLSTLQFADVDIGSGNLSITLTASNATVHAMPSAGITILGNFTTSVSLIGTVAVLNAYFAVSNNFHVQGDLNLNGTAAASIAVSDSDGISTVQLGTIQINIAAVNDPPTNTGSLPNTVTGIEDVQSPLNLSLVRLSDVDIGSGNLTVTLTATNATLQAASSPGIAIHGNGTDALSLVGTLAELNAYLDVVANIQLLGSTNLNGTAAASVAVTVSDEATTSPLGTIQIDLTAVDDPPGNSGTLPTIINVFEDLIGTFDISDVDLSIVDPNNGNLMMTLTATNATLHATPSAGITIGGNHTNTLTLAANVNALNAYLDFPTNLQLLGDLNVNGIAAGQVAVSVSDGVNTTPLGIVQIDITAVNDPPTNSGFLPSFFIANEDVTSNLDLNAIDVADVDIGSSNLTLTLHSTNAILQVSSAPGITTTGNGTSTVSITGPVATLNNYLDQINHIQVLGDLNLNGVAAASISFALSDGLNSVQLGTAPVNINAVNDPPINTGILPSNASFTEDIPSDLDLSLINLADVDIGSGSLTMMVTATNATLNATASPGITIIGNNSNHLSLTGNLATLNAYLDIKTNLQFLGALNVNGIAAASVSVSISDSTDTTQLGAMQADIAPVNDAPTNLGTLPSTILATEDVLSDLNLSSIQLFDVDIGSGNLTITLTATNATLQSISAAGISITGNGTGTLRLTGTLTALNTYLDITTNLQVLGASNLNGTAAASIATTVSDGSSTTQLGTMLVNLAAVNDPPSNTGSLPTTVFAVEDVAADLNLSLVNFFDVDIGSGNLTATLTATNATLQATSAPGISISGSGTNTLTLIGTLATLNAYLDVTNNLRILGALNLNGIAAASFAMTVSDGSITTPLGSVQVDLAAVNDPPTNSGSLPTSITGVEDVLSALNLSLINLSDVDIGSGNLTVTLTATNATLQATASAGISIGGNGTNTVSLTGTQTILNTYLDVSTNLQVLGGLNLNGTSAASIVIAASDGSNTTAFGTVQIDLTAVNDAPNNLGSLPTTVSGVEDVLSPLNLSLINLADVDIGSGSLTVTLTAINATLQATASAGISITGNNTSSVGLVGTLTALNAYFDMATNLQVLGGLNLNGTAAATIAIAASDSLLTTQLGTVQIDLTPVNDPPTNSGSLPTSVTGVEDVLSAIDLSAISITDVDIGSGNLTVTFTATNTTLQAIAAAGISITGSGTSILSLIGTPANLNAYLDVATNLRLLGNANLFGTAIASLAIAVSDGSNTTQLGTVQVDLTAVNDPPINSGSLPTSVTGVEDVLSTLNLSLINLTDVDIGSGNMTVALTATNATLQANAAAGISITGHGTSTLSLTGTLIALNAYLDITTNVQVLGSLNLNGTAVASIAVAASDGTNTTPLGTVQVNLTAVNDAPINAGNLPSSLTSIEDVLSTLDLSPINLLDVDIGSGNLTVILTATNAILQTTASAGIAISGNGTSTVTLVGTQAALNVYLDVTTNLQILGNLNLNGTAAASVEVDVSDSASTAHFGTVQIDITSVNDVPVNLGSLPTTVSGVEDVLSSINLSLMNVSDVDIGSGSLTVILTATNATLQGTAAAGITIGGNGTSNLSLTGTPATLNAYLDVATNVRLLGALNLNGTAAASVAVAVSDSLSTTPLGSIQINLSAVNDAPTVSENLPASITNNQLFGTPLDLTSVVVSDVDIGSGLMTATFIAQSGTFQAANATGITIVGNNTKTMTLTGTLANLNSYFATTNNIRYNNLVGLLGLAADSINISVSDNGNTGSGVTGSVHVGTIQVNGIL